MQRRAARRRELPVSREDRDFVFRLLDEMAAYEQQGAPGVSPIGASSV